MNCARFERDLEALLDGRLDAAAGRRMTLHAAGCDRCRELEELSSGPMELAPAGPAPDLTAAILARTAGDGCGRAGTLLAGGDASLDDVDRELLAAHTEHCAGCAALERTLAELDDLLPRLARLDPGTAFTAAVVERTSGAASRSWGRRLTAAAWRLAQRPRFAWEAAYVAAAVFTVAMTVQGSALLAGPETFRSLTAATRPELTENGRTVWSQRFDSLGKRAWQATGGESLEQLTVARVAIEESYRRTSGSRGALKEHGNELAAAVTDLDVKRGTSAIVEVGEELGAFVQTLIGQERTDDGEENNESLGSNETP